MEYKLIDIIFDSLNSMNLYNYDNDALLKDVEIKKYTNILGNEVIDIKIGKTTYTVNIIESYKESEDK